MLTLKRGIWIPLVVAALLILVFYPLKDLAVTKAGVQTSSEYFKAVNIALGRWLHEEAPPTATIAVIDAGAIPYYSELRTIDTGGLNDEYIAHNGFSVEYVLSRKSDIVILAGIGEEKCLPVYWEGVAFLENPQFKSNYRLSGRFNSESKCKERNYRM